MRDEELDPEYISRILAGHGCTNTLCLPARKTECKAISENPTDMF
jgi:hypothetical protein